MVMRKGPKVALSPLQRKRFVRIVGFIIVLVFAWLFFMPGNGLYFRQKEKKRLANLEMTIKQLAEENETLKQEIESLKKDEGYMEKVAREHHGMLKKNEQVFDFEPQKKK